MAKKRDLSDDLDDFDIPYQSGPSAKAKPAAANKGTPAKKKKAKAKKPVNRANAVDEFLGSGLSTLSGLHGVHQGYVLTEECSFDIGLKLKAFSLETQFRSTVFPFGRFIQIVGPPESGKSALAFEFIRWFREAMGGGLLNDAELKLSKSLLLSLLHYDRKACRVQPCYSLEGWQRSTMAGITKFQQTLEPQTKDGKGVRKDALGRIYPFNVTIDSLMAHMTESTQEKIKTQGHGSPAHPREALEISQFVKTAMGLIYGWPITVVAINHLHLGRDQDGRDTRSKSGGQLVNFAETLEIEVNKSSYNKRISLSNLEGNTLEIKLFKNSLGATTNEYLQVEMVWWMEEDPETGLPRQQTQFRWHTATTQLLFNEKNRRHAKLKRVLAHQKVPKEKLYFSKPLGIGPNDAVDAETFGEAVMGNPDILNQLRFIYGIREDCVFQPGVDLLKQRDMEIKRRELMLRELRNDRKARGLGQTASTGRPPAEDDDDAGDFGG